MRLDLSRFKRRRTAAMLAVGALAVTGVAVLPTLPAFAATSCSVTGTPAPWTESPGVGGYTFNLNVTNTGDAWNGWTLRVTLPSGQSLTQGWSANWTLSGSTLTATNLDWNANVGTNGTASIGYNGRWTGSFVAPTAFSVNNVNCGGTTPPSSTTTTTSRPPSSSSTTSRPPSSTTSRPPSSSTSSRPPSSSTTTSIPPCQPNCPPLVDNPFAGAQGYVNPDWSAQAAAEPGGTRVSNVPTGIWMDRVAAIGDPNGDTGGNGTSLDKHLRNAVALDASNGNTPVYAEFVIYDLPNRDCSALASNGEFRIDSNGLNLYKTTYIDVIRGILAKPAYNNIRKILVIEIDSLPNLITNLNVKDCADAQSSGAYVQGIQYALGQFASVPNTYNYIDAAHHAWIGWDSNFGPTAQLMSSTANGAVGGRATVTGFITNTANYSVLSEPFFTPTQQVGGQSVANTPWISFNPYIDELTFATAFRTRLIAEGFPSSIGMIIDTSRNGWGNCVVGPCQPLQTAPNSPNRPTAASTSTDPTTFVNQSRIDRRIHAGNWCNQAGAGLGERPRANPLPNNPAIDAYVWIKPPGESDGSSTAIPNDEGKGFDRMCDPTYRGSDQANGGNLTGALANAPIAGRWFPEHFEVLVRNAYPAL